MIEILASDSGGGGNALAAILAVLGFFLFLFLVTMGPILVGGLIGWIQEKQHFEELARREGATADFPLSDLASPPPGLEVGGGELVEGSVVIAADYFKNFKARFRKLIGGEFHGLQAMQEQGKREAILRMKESAIARGAVAVCKVRVVTSTIAGKQPDSVAGAEVLASGTALFAGSSGRS